jgi:ribonuclease HII
MARLRTKAPPLTEERAVWAEGGTVAGVDEVGRGAWAGPLTLAVVVPPRDRRLTGVRDSKQLSPTRRSALEPRIKDWAIAWSIGEASAADDLGMSDAQRLAWRRALEGLAEPPGTVLADGAWDFVGGARMLVEGDRRSLAIAAASVLAKVHRDRGMVQLGTELPWYDFATNKGYPSPTHQAALHHWGPSAWHRTSWAWVEDLPWTVRLRGQRTLPGI